MLGRGEGGGERGRGEGRGEGRGGIGGRGEGRGCWISQGGNVEDWNLLICYLVIALLTSQRSICMYRHVIQGH